MSFLCECTLMYTKSYKLSYYLLPSSFKKNKCSCNVKLTFKQVDQSGLEILYSFSQIKHVRIPLQPQGLTVSIINKQLSKS